MQNPYTTDVDLKHSIWRYTPNRAHGLFKFPSPIFSICHQSQTSDPQKLVRILPDRDFPSFSRFILRSSFFKGCRQDEIITYSYSNYLPNFDYVEFPGTFFYLFNLKYIYLSVCVCVCVCVNKNRNKKRKLSPKKIRSLRMKGTNKTKEHMEI